MNVSESSVRVTVDTSSRSQAVDITRRVEENLSKVTTARGVNLWVPHTTAGITVNESADPNLMEDVIDELEELVPWNNDYKHIEDNAAAHIRSVLLGSHQWVPVSENSLQLGRWQGIYLLEWDGPRTRRVELYGG